MKQKQIKFLASWLSLAAFLMFGIAPSPVNAEQPDMTARRNLYQCQQKAAEYVYNLDKVGDEELFDKHLKDCLEAAKPVQGSLKLKGVAATPASLPYCTDADAAWCSSCWYEPTNTWCCTKRNNDKAFCGKESNTTCDYTPCSGGCANACRKPPPNSGGATDIKIINNTDSDVDIAFVTGALTKKYALGACNDPNNIISYQWVANNTAWCGSPKAAGETNAGWCTGTVPKRGYVELKRTGDDARKCLTGAIMLGGKQSCPGSCPVGVDNCNPEKKTGPGGFTQAEFTFNPTNTTTEGVNISLVNGVNYAMSINLPGTAWTIQDSKIPIKVIGPNAAINGNNNKPGIYPPGCTDCTQLVGSLPCPNVPPNFSSLGCQPMRQCHAQRGGVTGGTVEFVIENKF